MRKTLWRARKKSQGTEVQFESLEPRLLLSGDVSVKVSGGNMYIRGDAADNHIVIDREGLAEGQYRIRGEDGTKIDGQDEVIIDGVRRSVFAYLENGDDRLTFNDADVSGDIVIRAGKGNDTINILGGAVGRKIRIDGGSGDNTVVIDGVDVAGAVRIFGGKDADILEVNASNFAKHIVFYAGSGDNQCTVSESTVGGLYFYGNSGSMVLGMDNAVFNQSVNVRQKNGAADIDITGSTFNRNVGIGTGNDADDVRISDSTFKKIAKISTNGGDDNVTAEDVNISIGLRLMSNGNLWYDLKDYLIVDTGRGDDSVTYQNVGGNVRMDGGAGEDSLTEKNVVEPLDDGIIHLIYAVRMMKISGFEHRFYKYVDEEGNEIEKTPPIWIPDRNDFYRWYSQSQIYDAGDFYYDWLTGEETPIYRAKNVFVIGFDGATNSEWQWVLPDGTLFDDYVAEMGLMFWGGSLEGVSVYVVNDPDKFVDEDAIRQIPGVEFVGPSFCSPEGCPMDIINRVRIKFVDGADPEEYFESLGDRIVGYERHEIGWKNEVFYEVELASDDIVDALELAREAFLDGRVSRTFPIVAGRCTLDV